MENLTKENVYVKVESKEQAYTYAAVLRHLNQSLCDSFYVDTEYTSSNQDSLIYSIKKWTCGNKGNLKEITFGQLIDILMQSEKIAVRVDNEKEFKGLLYHYKKIKFKFNGDPNPKWSNWDGTPLIIQYCDECRTVYERFSGTVYPFRDYKIIPFSDFAKEHNIKLPIITTVDGVDLFEGDKFWHAYNIKKIWRLNTSLKNEGCAFRLGKFESKHHLIFTAPSLNKSFSTKELAQKWIDDQNNISINKSEANSIRQIMQNAITVLMSHADGDFVSKDEANNVGFDLHNLMISLPETFILDDILNEVNRAESKHTNWPDDKLYGASIVAEEFGEMMREAVKIQMNEPDASLDNLRKETIQTAATCIRLLKNL